MGYKHVIEAVYTNTFQTTKARIIASIGLLAALILAVTPLAYADRFDTQIKELQNQNANNAAAQDVLEGHATDLAGTIAALQTEIAALEGHIRENRAKDAKLQEEISKAEAELEHQKAVLSENIKQMYVDDEMSTLEMLASSKTIGDYVDREQYRNSVQDKITETVAHINALKEQLDKQKKEVEQLLKDQQAMQSRLNEQKAENNRLLSLNQQQQAEYDRRISGNNAKISELKRQQAIENARYNIGRATYGGSGGYPWANVSYPSYSPDPWGMYKRECVSYTAWKVASSGRHMPYWGGRGNAKLWDDNARRAGIPVDTNPRVGDVAISNSGTYGHAMYVEAVHGDGTITVSQYNASWDGKYSVAKRSVTGLVFIHF